MQIPQMAEDKTQIRPLITLVSRRTIRATARRLFEAWTEPIHLRKWWGPEGIQCIDAVVDLRVGGSYRIANRLPDGECLWITGEFELIEPPHRLIYTWYVEGIYDPLRFERVTVTFEQRANSTEVIVVHERIPDRHIRDQHEQGWQGCLKGLARYCSEDPTS